MTLRRFTEPAELPLSVQEMKFQLNIDADISRHDAQIMTDIEAATRHVEARTGRPLVKQQWQKFMDAFPDCGGAIEIPKPPVISVDRIDFVDVDGLAQTLAPLCYQLDSQSETAWIVPAYGFIWPSVREYVNSVTITFTAGYGVAAMVPSDLKKAIKLLASHWFSNRDAVNVGGVVTEIPLGFEELIGEHCLVRFE